MKNTFFEVRLIDFKLSRNERIESTIFEVKSTKFWIISTRKNEKCDFWG